MTRIERRVSRRVVLASGLAAAAFGAGCEDQSPVRPEPGAGPLADAVAKALKTFTNSVSDLKATAGVSVLDVDGGKVLGSHRADDVFNPASNAKLLTAASALDRFGPEHRFLSGVYGRPAAMMPQLVLRGRGDPTLSTESLLELAMAVYRRGVREVEDILVDQTFFEGDFVPPAFEQQPNEWAAFRAPIAALSVNSNAVTFFVRARRKGSAAEVTSDAPGYVVWKGSVDTVAAGDPENIQLSLVGTEDGRLEAKLGGNIPEDSRLAQFSKRVDDPRLLAGYIFREGLHAAGVKTTGVVKLGGQDQTRLLTSHHSIPLADAIKALGKDSNNFAAEMLFRALALRDGAGPPADEVKKVLTARDAWTDGMTIMNGSGLFDANRVSPSSIVRLLRSMALDTRLAPEFLSHLAVGGIDGTMRSRLREVGKHRAIRAKTGTLADVVALAGYVAGRDQTVAFAILINELGGRITDGRKAIDRFTQTLANAVVG